MFRSDENSIFQKIKARTTQAQPQKILKIKADLEMEVLHAAKGHKMLGLVSTNIKHGQQSDAQKVQFQFRLQTAPVAFRLLNHRGGRRLNGRRLNGTWPIPLRTFENHIMSHRRTLRWSYTQRLELMGENGKMATRRRESR